MSSPLLKQITQWDAAAARHILSRACFGYTLADINTALSMTLDAFVDTVLLANTTLPTPPTWVTETPDPSNNTLNRTRQNELINWFLVQMQDTTISMREKMTLFLHNHFTSEYSKVQIPQYMYMQNNLFRSAVFGNFKTLTKAVGIDPGMLIYLDGRTSSKTAPNENYGRELLELFTIGIGNYTEDDIKAAARAYTGWRINGLTSYLNTSLYDSGSKTFMSQTGNFNNDQIVDIVFSKQQTAQFICRKLYKEFVHYEPNEQYVTEMAAVFRNSGYELKPVLSAMLKSEFFHSPEIRGAKIKNPVELIIGAFKKFNVINPDNTYLSSILTTLNQSLFEPPDVRGWEVQRKWISATTYPTRNQFTDTLVTGKKPSGTTLSYKISAVPFARTFATSENAPLFIEDCCTFLCEYPLSTARKESLLATLLDGTTVANWSTFDPLADTRLRSFYKALMRLPEFQLC